MSNDHPIPKALRDRFDQIEDAICRNRMERDAVFTQMRTAVQAHFMSADPQEGDHDGRQLEWERCENKRLREALEAARNDLLAVAHLVPGDYITKSVASAETAIARDDPNRLEPVGHPSGFHEGGYVGPFPACPPGEVGAVLELNVLYPTGIAAAVYSAEPDDKESAQ